MKFQCINSECEDYLKVDDYFNNTLKLIEGKLVSNNAPCPKCNKLRDDVTGNDKIPISEKNISMGEYSSMNPQQQKEVLKKRSHEHFKKEIKPFKEHQMNAAMSEMRNLSKK